MIGAYFNDSDGQQHHNSGHVRIYSWDGSAWNQLGDDIDGEAEGDRSGWSVSLAADGRTVAISAERNGGNGIDSGHVRIYSWDGINWNQLGEDIDGEAAGDRSGTSISLSADGHTISIGAYWNDGNGENAGHVRVYSWDGLEWNQMGVDIDAEGPWDRFGQSVSLSSDGRMVAIGEPYDDSNGLDSGCVRVYSWSGSAWTQFGLDLDGETAGDQFGTDVSFSADGQTVVMGAPLNDGSGNDSGHVRIFQLTPSASSLSTFIDTISIGVTPVNDVPMLDEISDINMNEDAPEQTIYLTGITAGGAETQEIRVTATSSNTVLIPGPTVTGPLLTDVTNGLVASYRFSGDATDESGAGHDATVMGASLTLDRNGVRNDAYHFASNSDEVQQSSVSGASMPTGDFTVSLWAYPEQIDGDARILVANQELDQFQLVINPFVGSAIDLYVGGYGVSGNRVHTDPLSWNLNTWYQITVTRAGDQVTFYRDGAVVGAGTLALQNTAAITDRALSFGRRNDSRTVPPHPIEHPWVGSLDDILVYDRALSSSELERLHDGSQGSLVEFTPVADQSGTATITVTVEDGGLDNNLATPEDNGVINRTVIVRADPVNDAPILDPAASPQLPAIFEDAAAPVGQVGTLVSELIDTDGTRNNFNDVDGDLPGIAITGVNLHGGSLWYSIDDGSTWLNVGAVSDAVPRLLSADATTRVYYEPASDFTGTVSDVILFNAWDRVLNWHQLGLDIDAESAGYLSSRSVSLSADGQTVAIGANYNDGNGNDSGHTRIYHWTGSAWQQLGLDIDGEAADDESGLSVSLSADGQDRSNWGA